MNDPESLKVVQRTVTVVRRRMDQFHNCIVGTIHNIGYNVLKAERIPVKEKVKAPPKTKPRRKAKWQPTDIRPSA